MTQDKNERLMKQMAQLVHHFRSQMAGGDGRHGRREDERSGMPGRRGGGLWTCKGSRDGQEDASGKCQECKRGVPEALGEERMRGMGRGREGERHGCGHDRDRRPPMARERVLRLIGEEEGISQKNLALVLGIRPQSLSELLGKLEKDEFVVRTQNEEDKREILVSLTEKGRERAKEVEEAQAKRAAELFAPLTESEKDTLSILLEKLFADCEEE